MAGSVMLASLASRNALLRMRLSSGSSSKGRKSLPARASAGGDDTQVLVVGAVWGL
jgi:hypothetical protein